MENLRSFASLNLSVGARFSLINKLVYTPGRGSLSYLIPLSIQLLPLAAVSWSDESASACRTYQ